MKPSETSTFEDLGTINGRAIRRHSLTNRIYVGNHDMGLTLGEALRQDLGSGKEIKIHDEHDLARAIVDSELKLSDFGVSLKNHRGQRLLTIINHHIEEAMPQGNTTVDRQRRERLQTILADAATFCNGHTN